jgi:hypothetical protein
MKIIGLGYDLQPRWLGLFLQTSSNHRKNPNRFPPCKTAIRLLLQAGKTAAVTIA